MFFLTQNLFLILLIIKPQGSTGSEPSCLWCDVYSHNTKDCKKLKRVKIEEAEAKAEKDAKTIAVTNSHGGDLAFPAFTNYENRSKNDFFADSGASRHMTQKKKLLTEFKPVKPGTWTVKGVGNTTLSVHGIGKVHLTTMVIEILD